MSVYKFGQMWSRWKEADLFLVTGNSTVRHGQLVMGAGSAGEVKNRWGYLPKIFGDIISKNELFRDLHAINLKIYKPYYLIVSDKWPDAKLGLFQTKEDYRASADSFIISTACQELEAWIAHARVKLGRDPLVVMPYPGIGLGGLSPNEVAPYIETLPDCVEIWRHEVDRPIEFPDDHELACLLTGDRTEYLANLCNLLGKPFHELETIANDSMFFILSENRRQRIMMYYLFESYFESGNIDNSWHAARNKMRSIGAMVR